MEGSGCPKCGNIAMGIKNKATTESFIDKAKSIYEDIYDYADTVYVDVFTPITYRCIKHNQMITQTPTSHFTAVGCKQCIREEKASTTPEFITKAKIIHGDDYNYDKVKYIVNNLPVDIYTVRNIRCYFHKHLQHT